MRQDTDFFRDFCSLVGLRVVRLGPAVVLAFFILIRVSGGHASVSDAGVSERWGEFQWLSPWIEAGANYREPREGQFSAGSASFGGRWTGWAGGDSHSSPQVEAQIAIGTRSLVMRPLRYTMQSNLERSSEPTLVDAFAGVSGSWGRLRFGMIPITFGLENGVESARPWLRPLILRRGLIGLRDLGFGYSVSAGGFHSDWYVHNGEAGDDLDREIWMTARWEYRLRTERAEWRVGASGQVGRTTPDSTHPVGTTPSLDSELDPDQSSRLRFGGIHMASRFDSGLGLELEAFAGEILQDIRTRRLRSLRFDFDFELHDNLSLLLRGEGFDPDTQVPGDMIHELSVGVQHYLLRGPLKRSLRGILVATKEWKEPAALPVSAAADQPRHRVEFVLRFSPDLP